MKNEAGKCYKTRDGRKVGPMVRTGHGNHMWDDGSGTGWTDKGTVYNTMDSSHDIIAEWTDDQIGTLAELDVKPGDVVENISHKQYKGLQWTCYDKHPEGYSDQPCAVYDNDGRSGYIYVHDRDEYKFRLISRATSTPSIDLTAITTPFGLLDKAIQDAMIAHGGPYEYYDGGDGWLPTRHCSDVPRYAHRVKPGPKRETVTKDAWIDNLGSVVSGGAFGNCTITYDTIDGVIDMATYRVVAK